MAVKMRLRDLSIYADKKIVDRFRGGFVTRFHIHSVGVTELYRSLLGQILMMAPHAQYVFHFTDEISVPPADNQIAPVQCLWPFDFCSYQCLLDDEKRRAIGCALIDASTHVAQRLGWNIHALGEVHERAKALDFRFEGVLKKCWISPDRRLKLAIAFSFGLKNVTLTAMCYDQKKKENIGHILLGTLLPDVGSLHHSALIARWTSNTQFELETADFQQKKLIVNFEGSQ